VKESQQTGHEAVEEAVEEEAEELEEEVTALVFIDSIVDQGWVIFGTVTFFADGSRRSQG
jgi:hypothetical protein